MSRTVLTGATGFIGSHVAKLLLERGDEVLAPVRPDTSPDALRRLGVETVEVDLADRDDVRRLMRRASRLFHSAGLAGFGVSRGPAFAVNLEGTKIVLEEALRSGLERVVLTSSVAAVGPALPGEIADETNVWDAGRLGIAYVDSKREAELAALRLVDRGLPLVVVNPSWVLGSGGRSAGNDLVRRFLRREIPFSIDGTLNVVGVDDVAHGHLLADERGRVGERYILGNRNFTMDRLFSDLGRLSGVEPPAVKLRVSVALAIAAGRGRLPAGPSVPSPAEIRAASLNWAFTNGKAKRELGWTTSPHEDALEAAIGWFREHDERGELEPTGARQPLALRIAGGVMRRIPI